MTGSYSHRAQPVISSLINWPPHSYVFASALAGTNPPPHTSQPIDAGHQRYITHIWGSFGRLTIASLRPNMKLNQSQVGEKIQRNCITSSIIQVSVLLKAINNSFLITLFDFHTLWNKKTRIVPIGYFPKTFRFSGWGGPSGRMRKWRTGWGKSMDGRASLIAA